MITVRFPSGVSLTYNEAGFVVYKPIPGAWELYREDREKGWVASIQTSSGCIIERCKPCKIENYSQIQTLDSAADLVLSGLRRVHSRKLSKLKLALTKFNRQTWRWKD